MSFITFNNLLRFEQGIKNILSQVLGGLSSTVGNSTLNTAAQNLTDAINEHEVDIGDMNLNTTATDLTGAINETKSSIGSLNDIGSHPMRYANIEIDSEGNGPPTATLSLKSSVDKTEFYKPLTYTFYRHIRPASPPYTPTPSQATYEQIQTGTNNIYANNTGYDRWIFGKITDVSGRSVISSYALIPADES